MKRLDTLLGSIAAGMTVFPVARNEGIAHRSLGPSGSPKRNQERSIKRMAQRSRAINRMRNR